MNMRKWVLHIGLSALLLLGFPRAIFALPLPEPGQTGSITVRPNYLDEDGRPITDGRIVYTGTVSVRQVQPRSQAVEGSLLVSDYEAVPETQPMEQPLENSTAVFTGLHPGYYLVQQKQEPSVESYFYPFVVRLPMENPAADGTWLWDIVAHPKFYTAPTIHVDQIIEIPAGYRPGQLLDATHRPAEGTEIFWEIRVDIPLDILDAEQFTVFDFLDERLHYNKERYIIFVIGSNGESVPIDEECCLIHSTLTDGDLTLTPKGRQMLADALYSGSNYSATLYIQYSTSIHLDDDNQGLVPNHAELLYTNSFMQDMRRTSALPQNYEDEAVAETFSIHIQKLSTDTLQPIEGAGFKIYHTEEDARAGRRAINDPETGQEWYVVSDEESRVYFNGLAEGIYWLAEITTPEGYASLGEPHRVELRVGAPGVVNYAYEMPVLNNTAVQPAEPGTPLPGKSGLAATGDPAHAAFYILMAAVAGALLLILVHKRRRR